MSDKVYKVLAQAGITCAIDASTDKTYPYKWVGVVDDDHIDDFKKAAKAKPPQAVSMAAEIAKSKEASAKLETEAAERAKAEAAAKVTTLEGQIAEMSPLHTQALEAVDTAAKTLAEAQKPVGEGEDAKVDEAAVKAATAELDKAKEVEGEVKDALEKLNADLEAAKALTEG